MKSFYGFSFNSFLFSSTFETALSIETVEITF